MDEHHRWEPVKGLGRHLQDTRMSGFAPARELAARADRSIRFLFERCALRIGEVLSIAALGGYGRRELCPFSDLDILFLIERKIPGRRIEEALKEMLYPLWDSGFSASYSVRTVRQALQDARSDFFFRTSLMDARCICGSDAIFRKLQCSLSADRYLNKGRRFISDLSFHTRMRHEKFGDASYFLEPNIKDGRGGLRDYQSVLWILSVHERLFRKHPAPIISPADLSELNEAAVFMLKTRFTLHKLAGRKTDRMHLEYQEELAREMGHTPGPDESVVEAFLREFHTRAVMVRSMLETLLRYLDRPKGLRCLQHRAVKTGPFTVYPGLLSFTRPEHLRHEPLTVMSAFRKMAQEHIFLTPQSRSRIRSLTASGVFLRENRPGCLNLLKILQSPHAEHALTYMLETGILEQLVPEFRKIRGRTIFDVFHTYTVDLHSIHTVCKLNDLKKAEREIFARVHDREALYLAAFLHDIGKGCEGRHTDAGAEMIRTVAARFGFDKTRTGLAAFLVRNHLIMADLATGRDLSEEKVISDFARKVSSPGMLSMLYLLTAADSLATGPLAWSEWKASLVRELYARTLNILEKGVFKNPGDAVRLDEKWRELIRAAGSEPGVSGRLWALPQAYVLATDVKDIRRHLVMGSRLKGDHDVKVDIVPLENHTLVTFITRDRPGLFSLLTGLLAANRLEIISARIFTWYDGTVADTFKVLAPWHDYRVWNTIEQELKDVIDGKADLEARIGRIRSLRTGDPSPVRSGGGASLSIDNDTSDFFTIIEVRSHGKIRLVHDLSRAVSGMGLDIHRAFLAHDADRVCCVLYVVDEGKRKLTEEARWQEVLLKIREAIDSERFISSPARENRV